MLELKKSEWTKKAIVAEAEKEGAPIALILQIKNYGYPISKIRGSIISPISKRRYILKPIEELGRFFDDSINFIIDDKPYIGFNSYEEASVYAKIEEENHRFCAGHRFGVKIRAPYLPAKTE